MGEGLDGPKAQKYKERDILTILYFYLKITILNSLLGLFYPQIPVKAVFIEEYNKVKEKGLVYFADSTHPMLNPVLSSG